VKRQTDDGTNLARSILNDNEICRITVEIISMVKANSKRARNVERDIGW
jgi:hypothetical protein